MQKAKATIPVYDIQSVEQVSNMRDDVIADHFAPYQQRHPHFHTPHRHLFYHLLLFTKGSGTHTIDFEQFPVQRGQIYFMIPGQVHNWHFKGEADGYVVNFSENLFRSFLSNQSYLQQFLFFRGVAKDSVIKLSANIFEQVKDIFERLIEEVQSKQPHNRDMVCIELLSLFILINRCCVSNTSKQIPEQSQLLLYNFRKLVGEYYAEKRLPKEYAAMLYITPNHLNALCQDLLRPIDIVRAGDLVEIHVDVPSQQQCNEDHHFGVNKRSVAFGGQPFVDDGPGHKENDFNVEQNKEHRNNKELHRESFARRAHRVFAALVGHQLCSGAFSLANELGKYDVADRKARGDNEHQKNRQVIRKVKRHPEHNLHLPENDLDRSRSSVASATSLRD